MKKKRNIFKQALIKCVIQDIKFTIITMILISLVFYIDNGFHYSIKIFLIFTLGSLLFIMTMAFRAKGEIKKWYKDGEKSGFNFFDVYTLIAAQKILEAHREELTEENFNEFKKVFLWF